LNRGQETRNKLTDYWANHYIKKGDEYAILTNLIHQEWRGVSGTAHKDLKRLKTQNLRDHLDEAKLILTVRAELSTRKIAHSRERGDRPDREKMVTGEHYLPPGEMKKSLKIAGNDMTK